MLPLLAILFAVTSAYNLTCHCLNGTECHSNGFCAFGCEEGWYGPGCQVGNLALGQPANQSSTYVGNILHFADFAVDGHFDVNSSIPAQYCSHTEFLKRPGSAWWYVVLNSTRNYVLTKVVIFNRANVSAALRLTNFLILYSNETEGDPDPNISTWKECARENGSIANSSLYTCNGTAIAKRVAVYLTTEQKYNQATVLTLCEVQIFGYQQYDCPNGFTGPGCLLRSCGDCVSSGGQCTGEYRNCRYEICANRSLLPPDCWITLSDHSTAKVRTKTTCNSLVLSVDLPYTRPNIEATWLQLQVNSSADEPLVVNTTMPIPKNNSITLNYNNAKSNTSYYVSVKPLYCANTTNVCFYATSSKTAIAITGQRDYVFYHNSSCIFIYVYPTFNCEPLSSIKVTCISDEDENGTIKSSSFTACGLKRGREYTCSFEALTRDNTVERRSAYIAIEPRFPSCECNSDMSLLAIIIGCSAGILVVTFVVIISFVCYRRQQCTKFNQSVMAKDSTTKLRALAGTPEGNAQPASIKSQCQNCYEVLDLASGLNNAEEYAILK